MNGDARRRALGMVVLLAAGCGPKFGAEPGALPEPEARADAAAPVADAAPPPAPDLRSAEDAAAARDADTRASDAADAAATIDGGSPPDGAPLAGSVLFGFENAAPDWTSTETALTRDTTTVSEGSASLAFTMSGNRVAVRSRPFDTAELKVPPTSTLSIDLFLAVAQPSGANIGARFECAAAKVSESGIPPRVVTALPTGRWAPLLLPMPAHVAAALAKNYWQGCKIWIEVNNLDGLVRLDRMTFAP